MNRLVWDNTFGNDSFSFLYMNEEPINKSYHLLCILEMQLLIDTLNLNSLF